MKTLCMTLVIMKCECLPYRHSCVTWINPSIDQWMLSNICVLKFCLCCPPVARMLNSERLQIRKIKGLSFTDPYFRGVWMFRLGIFLGHNYLGNQPCAQR